MNPEFSDIDPEIQQLLDDLANESLNEAQWIVLREYIRCDPAVKAAYFETIGFEAMLHREFRGSVAAVTDQPVKPVTRKMWLPVSAGIAATLLLGLYWLPDNAPIPASEVAGSGQEGPKTVSRIVDTTVARITASDQAQWMGERSEIPVGTWLKPGKYELQKGNAEITFDTGASVVLTPNTVFEVVDNNMGFLHAGKIASHVPESAIGFQVQTSEGKIEDLGTKFGLSVRPNGETEVHVLEGIVEASNHQSENPVSVVSARQAVRLQKEKRPTRVDYSGDTYTVTMGPEHGRVGSSYLHYSFDDLQEDVQKAKETGCQSDGQSYPAKIITPLNAPPTWNSTKGKFGKSIYLAGDSTYLKAGYRKITGNSARTIAFWVKIPPNTSTSHAYAFAAWGIPRTLKGQKWQLGWNPNYRRDCGVEGAIRTEFGKGFVTGSTDLRDGRWHHVVSVFQGDNGQHISSQIRHYVDGKLEAVSGYNDEDAQINTSGGYKPLLIGRYLDFHHPVFKGVKAWMDEFYLFEAALTPEQINNLYLHNKAPAEDDYLPSLF